MFELHPRLNDDSHALAALGLCEVRLLDDARFPWLLLVPQRPGIAQVTDLAPDDRRLLWDEIVAVQEMMQRLWQPQRVNLGIIGIKVPQLHVHLVARHENDAAWPDAVWNAGRAETYPQDLLSSRLDSLRTALAQVSSVAGA